ncbi:MAG: DUF5691 domain-containing protein [Pseudomonadota bacterium]
MHDIARDLENVKARWMTGSGASTACPDAWSEALGPEPDLSLLALTGQYMHLAMRPVAPGEMAERALLPLLSLPDLPDPLRPELQRLLASKFLQDIDIVRLIAARGYVVSPTDWMPGANDVGLPDVYTPWLEWLAEVPERTEDAPSAETWDTWSPQARLAHVERLRKTDPAAGRALIEAVAPNLAADARLRLITYLGIGLAEEDVPLLNALQSDRSSKVQALATSLLARLGQAKADAEAVAEMVDFFEKAKAGILSRKTVVSARKLKTAAQRNRRAALVGVIPFAALAEGLGMSPHELVHSWDFEDGTDAILTMVAGTATDAEVQDFIKRMIEESGADGNIGALIDRLPGDVRPALAPHVIARDSTTFSGTARLLSVAPGTVDFETIRRAAAFKQFEKAVKDEKDTSAHAVNMGFANLGLIADRAAAQSLTDHFTSAGLMAADPRLAMLRLNAAL